jgi:hypothetical protein
MKTRSEQSIRMKTSAAPLITADSAEQAEGDPPAIQRTNVSDLKAKPWPRWRSPRARAHDLIGIEWPVGQTGSRVAVLLSGHLAPTREHIVHPAALVLGARRGPPRGCRRHLGRTGQQDHPNVTAPHKVRQSAAPRSARVAQTTGYGASRPFVRSFASLRPYAFFRADQLTTAGPSSDRPVSSRLSARSRRRASSS